MESNPQNVWDVLTESAKAFANLILGESQTDFLKENVVSYSQLLEENEQLKEEVASLKVILPFKDKYENLQKEFRKVAAERDSLSSQALQTTHLSADYERLKDAYQKTKGQLAAAEDQLERIKSSIDEFTALESLYQCLKTCFDRVGVDIRRIPTRVFIQFELKDRPDLARNFKFLRQAHDKWTRIK